jgi:hypothetical protein
MPDCELFNPVGGCRKCRAPGTYMVAPTTLTSLRTYTPRAVYFFEVDGVGKCVTDCTEITNEGKGPYVNGDDYTCKCAEGLEMDSDGYCKSCHDIHWACETCDLSAEECTTCKSTYNILNPDKTECWNKINNCRTPLAAQTWDFYQTGGDGELFKEDGNGFYYCPNCEKGYYWELSTIDAPGSCQRCSYSIQHCNTCLGPDRCTDCRGGRFISPDGGTCLTSITNCAVSSSNYIVKEDGVSCPQCTPGWFTNTEGGCDQCTVSNCAQCNNADECLKCSGD